MSSIFSSILQKELRSIQERKPRFSLRAFARQLGLSPSSLSKVISGAQGLSPQMAESVALKLKLPAGEVERFKKTAILEQAKKRRSRKKLEGAITIHDLELFELLSQWYNFVLLEWISMRPGIIDLSDISERLGVSEVVVRDSIKRLQRFKLLKRSGNSYSVPDKARSFGDQVPSRAIRAYHAHMIAKAASALEDQPFEKRNVSNVILRISDKNYDKVVEKIAAFRRDIASLTNNDPDADQIYALNFQFFSLVRLPYLSKGKI